MATGSAAITDMRAHLVQVMSPTQFRVGDEVTTTGNNRAQIIQIQASTLTLDSTLPDAAKVGDTLRIGDLVNNSVTDFRIDEHAGWPPTPTC